ncbi:DUF6759 domain-containing protein [Cloacibacterium normanense]|uniref:DUF6759 domain-containing protein n=1 Tax=Cloacibacterium normanense TaxID=237258 RepID=A0A1E5UEH1_9FLAO|nr:DUF6759 domain-containing protein [Cloacibacterium normanense]AZI68382.1 hypothetical protein EB819_00175 [Cloacibacterium normanense]OEL11065.1 hypothetical protein BHF72_2473 [Cloacibacterium normanense]SDO91014.1 hypothetical protein SAMN04489756_12813 [Cloacibacterium normanense]
MKNKVLLLILLVFSTFLFSQTSQELDKAMLSKDPNVIAEFIKKYPDNKNTPFLQRKLNGMTGSGNAAAKPSIQPLNTEKLEKQVEKSEAKGEPDAKAKRTAEVLTHLFNNDPNKKDAYVLIRNKSECNLIVKFEGKKFYNLDVPKMGENYILVQKGTYRITTMICNAQYASVKNITQDLEINLNAAKKVRK